MCKNILLVKVNGIKLRCYSFHFIWSLLTIWHVLFSPCICIDKKVCRYRAWQEHNISHFNIFLWLAFNSLVICLSKFLDISAWYSMVMISCRLSIFFSIINDATSNILFCIYIYIYVPLHTYLSISVEEILRSRITELNIACI